MADKSTVAQRLLSRRRKRVPDVEFLGEEQSPSGSAFSEPEPKKKKKKIRSCKDGFSMENAEVIDISSSESDSGSESESVEVYRSHCGFRGTTTKSYCSDEEVILVVPEEDGDGERVSDLSSSSSSDGECDDSDDEYFGGDEEEEEESSDSEVEPASKRKETSLGIEKGKKVMKTVMEEEQGVSVSDDVIFLSDDGDDDDDAIFEGDDGVCEKEGFDSEAKSTGHEHSLGMEEDQEVGTSEVNQQKSWVNDETDPHDYENSENGEEQVEETADYDREMDYLWAEMNHNLFSQISNTSSLDGKEGNANEVHNGKKVINGDETYSKGLKNYKNVEVGNGKTDLKDLKIPKKGDVFNFLVNSIWEKHQAREGDVEEEVVEEEEFADAMPEKSDSEREMDFLWAEMNRCLASSQIGNTSALDNNGTNENDANQSTLCKHDFVLDEEIGLRCLHCSLVDIEIKDFIPPMDKFAAAESRDRRSYDKEVINAFGGIKFQASPSSPQQINNYAEGTVWDLVPGARESMFPHQRDGFEFIWKNLAGTIKLDELKGTCKSTEVVGCMISHGPGTGKTKLSLTFLKSFLEKFESCKPVIVAPASMLLPWEGEFRKWDIGVPFHNLNSLDFSGKENLLALNMLELSRQQGQNQNLIRMVKLQSWSTQKSVLGISYSLYEKLVGVNCTNGKNVARRKEWESIRKILLEVPSLLVLDEGHTARNKQSQIWQVLSRAQAKRRIILSGTPFQNNFEELHNVISLVRPKIARKIPSSLVKSSSKKVVEEDEIKTLINLISPFVHQKVGILEKNLPGLRSCVVVFNPSDLQKDLLVKIRSTTNNFKFEHEESLVAIHPSLLLECSLSEDEESGIDREMLQSLKVNSNEGCKTRFLMEFIRLCNAMNEKVLIFSQYIHPLNFILEQLSTLFGWSEGREVLLMHGKLQQEQRLFLINSFNDATHESKVLIASTRACSEGINLIGASRVVLLDVVWNPSVVRQAISRAYRLGQKRVVYSYHLITKETTEWEKNRRQDEKNRIGEMIFTCVDKEGRASWEDDVLDEMVRHEKLKGLFEKVVYKNSLVQ